MIEQTLIGHEAIVRTGLFLAIFSAVALSELIVPRRPRLVKRSFRWIGNGSVHLINAILPRLLFPILPVGMAVLWQQNGWGLLNLAPIPAAFSVVLTVLVFDWVIYTQHRLFHRTRLFWPLHRMHHTDMDLDLTSALRFHPLEIMISLLVKMAVVALLGPPAAGVILFDVILNGMAMFNHGNFRIPAGADRLLRTILVTPDMHRVHHSVLPRETNSNFGFSLSWWDRLFGTYRAEPQAGHDGMTIGLPGFLDLRYSRFAEMLLGPFRRRSSA